MVVPLLYGWRWLELESSLVVPVSFLHREQTGFESGEVGGRGPETGTRSSVYDGECKLQTNPYVRNEQHAV